MAIVFGLRALMQQGMSSLDLLCSSNLKANILQQFRDEEPKRECTTTKGKVLVEGDGVNDDLTNIELLSK